MQNAPSIVAVVFTLSCLSAQDESVFSMRPLATGEGFEMAAEVARLQDWLSTRDPDLDLRRELSGIHLFNWLRPEQGGALNPALAWFPRRIGPSHLNGSKWDYSLAMESPDSHAVPLFRPGEWERGPRPLGAPPSLVELVPIDMREPHFDQTDVEPESLRVSDDPSGGPAILYTIKAERRDAYGSWTESMIGKSVAIAVDGIVLTAPVIRGRIEGEGRITGGFTQREAEELVASLRGSGGTEDEQALAANTLILAFPGEPLVAMAYGYRLVHARDEQVRSESAKVLGTFGEAAAQAVPDLIVALEDDSREVRAEAITALGLIGPEAKAALPVLRRLRADRSRDIAERARAAVKQIDR